MQQAENTCAHHDGESVPVTAKRLHHDAAQCKLLHKRRKNADRQQAVDKADAGCRIVVNAAVDGKAGVFYKRNQNVGQIVCAAADQKSCHDSRGRRRLGRRFFKQREGLPVFLPHKAVRDCKRTEHAQQIEKHFYDAVGRFALLVQCKQRTAHKQERKNVLQQKKRNHAKPRTDALALERAFLLVTLHKVGMRLLRLRRCIEWFVHRLFLKRSRLFAHIRAQSGRPQNDRRRKCSSETYGSTKQDHDTARPHGSGRGGNPRSPPAPCMGRGW